MKGPLLYLALCAIVLGLLCGVGSFLIGLWHLSPGLFQMVMGAVSVWGMFVLIGPTLGAIEKCRDAHRFERARARLKKGKRP